MYKMHDVVNFAVKLVNSELEDCIGILSLLAQLILKTIRKSHIFTDMT